MGRYPFVTCANRFLDETKAYYSESTRKTMHYAFKRLAYVIAWNPRLATEAHVLEFEAWLEASSLKPGTKLRYRTYLKTLLEFYGNGAYTRLYARRLLSKANRAREPLPCPSAQRVEEILAALQTGAMTDPEALHVYGLAVMAAATGARLKEIVGAEVGDIDRATRELLVRHPKGEGRWAAPRRALILPTMRAHVADYLSMRARVAGPDDDRLVLAAKNIQNLRYRVNRRLGLNWSAHELRRAWGQIALDRGARIEAVSRGLGHRTTQTTEQYYARIKTDRAFEELEAVFQKEPQSSLIDARARGEKKGSGEWI